MNGIVSTVTCRRGTRLDEFAEIAERGGGEAFLTSDYNAEMITHVEGHPNLRDQAIFVGNPSDIIPHSFGTDLPEMRDWVPKHFDFCGYILGQHPNGFGERAELREKFGYQNGEKVCIVTVGGSGVGGNLIRRILAAYPIAKAAIPELRMIVFTGPRLDPAGFKFPKGVDVRYIVTTFQVATAQYLYTTVYCGRGEAELFIKECKLGLGSDTSPCQKATANQFRLLLHVAAYAILHRFRSTVLAGTKWERSTFAEIRLRLFKSAKLAASPEPGSTQPSAGIDGLWSARSRRSGRS